MEKEFVPYEQSLDLKELGFDEPCIKGYTEQSKGLINFANTHTNTSVKNTLPTKPFTAPLYQQAFRWFREKYKLYSHVRESYSFDNTLEFVTQINGSYVNHGIVDKPVNRFETHEEAELECLKKLIEIVKNK
jgi:hypothetical protein